VPDDITSEIFGNVFTGETMEVIHGDGVKQLPLSRIFANFPVAMLESI
jgi:hypothetical protein